MNSLQVEFVELCIANEVLRFGEFTLKSGRISPYFFNTGLFNRGRLLSQLAQHYARVLVEQVESDDFMLYGPAYKGIPLVAATALKLSDAHDLDIAYAFNRKEAKAHGEGGGLVGANLRGDVVIVDDVITAGTSIRQSVATITAAGATPHSVVIALDREEVADGEKLSAVQRVQKEFDIPVYSIINLHDLVAYLDASDKSGDTAGFATAIKAYRDKYGVGG